MLPGVVSDALARLCVCVGGGGSTLPSPLQLPRAWPGGLQFRLRQLPAVPRLGLREAFYWPGAEQLAQVGVVVPGAELLRWSSASRITGGGLGDWSVERGQGEGRLSR